jgi:hypothetical protein
VGLLLRLPNIVLSELEKVEAFGAIEKYVYLMAWGYDPDSLSGLARIAKLDRKTVATACRNLSRHGWMKMVPTAYKKKIRPAALIPHSAQLVMAKDLEEEYEMKVNKGEYLANKRMDWSLKNDEYITNARPGFLINTMSNEKMEYDRYDKENRFATEYNGDQHYRATGDYDENDVRLQATRDHVKKSISIQYGVTLLELTSDDLRPGVLEEKLDELVPHLKRGYVDTEGPYYKALIRLCSNCAAKAARERAKEENAARARAREANGAWERVRDENAAWQQAREENPARARAGEENSPRAGTREENHTRPRPREEDPMRGRLKGERFSGERSGAKRGQTANAAADDDDRYYW